LIAGLGWRSRFAIALGVLVLGVLVRHYLAGMDGRFFGASLHGAEGLVRYTVGDYAGAARAYRAHYATGYEPLPGLPSVRSRAGKRSSSEPKDVQKLLTEGEAALANFNEWRPELVITDLYMPRMDGLELCRRIRAQSNVPIIVLSVKAEEETKVEALDSGADDYVTKPFGIKEVIARVKRLAARGPSGAPAPGPTIYKFGDVEVRFEPRALCWILMPETLRGLWRQRLRWAQGGAENAVRNVRHFLRRPFSGLGPIYVDYCLSILWAYAVAFTFTLWLIALVPGVHLPVQGGGVIPESWGLVLCLTFLLQAAISMWLDGKYERGLRGLYFWMIWYPLVYWILIWATALVGFPKGVLRRRPRRARRPNADRGCLALVDLLTGILALVTTIVLLRFKLNAIWLLASGAATGFLRQSL